MLEIKIKYKRIVMWFQSMKWIDEVWKHIEWLNDLNQKNSYNTNCNRFSQIMVIFAETANCNHEPNCNQTY